MPYTHEAQGGRVVVSRSCTPTMLGLKRGIRTSPENAEIFDALHPPTLRTPLPTPQLLGSMAEVNGLITTNIRNPDLNKGAGTGGLTGHEAEA